MSPTIDDRIANVLPDVTAFRRDLHAHPELSWKEFETARKIRERLARLPRLRILPPLLETDVVALLNEDRPGRCIALRADIDALPIQEESNHPFISTVPGVMHACGHDGHTSVLLGTAMVLSQMADELPGRVKFIFQPAEEDGGGGGRLCERGVLDSPKVDAAVALHAWPMQPVGTIAIRPGPVTAANNEFVITVRGRGGHGAYPHRCVDPIVIAAEIVLSLQTIVARMVPPLDCAVVTVGQINAGTATNIIPAECELKGTIRYYRAETGEQIRERLRTIADSIARAHGAEAMVSIRLGYPSLNNDQSLTELVMAAAGKVVGVDRIITTEDPSMGAEDFAFYAQKVPASMFRLGVRPPGMDSYPGLHHPQFNFTDDALPVGIRILCEVTRRFLDQ